MGYLCIHGHFYQPPRENPWLHRVPRQPSAAPARDWNHRITQECYGPCTSARVLDGQARIHHVRNLFADISFDAGPTLMSWLHQNRRDIHDRIVHGDHLAVARWGHGTALAQGYNHAILPLCSPRDLRTQVLWGLADFRYRFGREAEGLWLPECAVDTPTLQALAEAGVRFTVVAPGQIEATQAPGEDWVEAPAGGPDPHHPYQVDLGEGRSITVFVYDGPLSQGVAFERLLDSGDRFYERLRAQVIGPDSYVHIATDGESYGHHHKLGEMGLAWAVQRIEQDPDVELLPYAAWLARHQPTHLARIREGSSWSCAHGIERWRSDCGCGTEGGSGAWRAPLRQALDTLRDAIDARFEPDASALLRDPWAARDAWIDVVLDPDALPGWLATHQLGDLSPDQVVRVRELMRMQHHRMLMFTSCGWFFDDVAGLEPVQDLAYAARAVDLASRLWPDAPWHDDLAADLLDARSKDPQAGSAADLLRTRVDVDRFDGVRAAPHLLLLRRAGAAEPWPAFRLTLDAEPVPGGITTGTVEERDTGRTWRVVLATRDTADGTEALAGPLTPDLDPADLGERLHTGGPLHELPQRVRVPDLSADDQDLLQACALDNLILAAGRLPTASGPGAVKDLQRMGEARAAVARPGPLPTWLTQVPVEHYAAHAACALASQAAQVSSPSALTALIDRLVDLQNLGVPLHLRDLQDRVLVLRDAHHTSTGWHRALDRAGAALGVKSRP